MTTQPDNSDPAVEATWAWIHDRGTNQHWNLLTVFEEMPPGQRASQPLKTEDEKGCHFVWRQALSKGRDHTLYAARTWFPDLSAAEELFAAEHGIRPVLVGDQTVDIRSLAASGGEEEAPPVTVPPHHESTGTPPVLQRTLPTRRVTAHVWSRLALDADLETWLGAPKLEESLTLLRSWIGVDLVQAQELIGATIWSRPNPWLRALRLELKADGKGMFLEAYPRQGCSLPPMHLTLGGQHPLGWVPVAQTPWEGTAVTIPSVHQLNTFTLQIHHEDGQLLEDRRLDFIGQVSFNMRLSGGSRAVELPSRQEEKHIEEVRLWRNAGRTVVGEADQVADTLRESQRLRRQEELRERGEFAYFGAFEKEASERARSFLRSRIREVNQRCIIADPYLGPKEVRAFALFVGSLDADIVILSGAEFLRKSPSEGEPCHGLELLDVVNRLQEQYPRFQPVVRVLTGRTCPLHDRFLVADDTVYHLGGSLNHFGERAMAITRIPAPEPVLDDLNRWVAGEESTPLEEWVQSLGQ